MDSEYGEDFKYCMECVSDIYCGQEEETIDPNQIQLELDEEEKEWNKSFGIEDADYEDVSDNYDGSMRHKSIVNEYLTNYQKTK